MTHLDKKIDDSVEIYLALWKERAFLNYKRKEITPRELSSLFQQKVFFFLQLLHILFKKSNFTLCIKGVMQCFFLYHGSREKRCIV